jgi:hypothetical protein
MGKCGIINFVIVYEVVSVELSIQKVDRDSEVAPDLIRYSHTRNSFQEYYHIRSWRLIYYSQLIQFTRFEF